jgi:hypothetical protein
MTTCVNEMRRQGATSWPRTCPECRLGPYSRELESACAVRMLPHTIPNRLHGATIDAEGCAI